MSARYKYSSPRFYEHNHGGYSRNPRIINRPSKTSTQHMETPNKDSLSFVDFLNKMIPNDATPTPFPTPQAIKNQGGPNAKPLPAPSPEQQTALDQWIKNPWNVDTFKKLIDSGFGKTQAALTYADKARKAIGMGIGAYKFLTGNPIEALAYVQPRRPIVVEANDQGGYDPPYYQDIQALATDYHPAVPSWDIRYRVDYDLFKMEYFIPFSPDLFYSADDVLETMDSNTIGATSYIIVQSSAVVFLFVRRTKLNFQIYVVMNNYLGYAISAAATNQPIQLTLPQTKSYLLKSNFPPGKGWYFCIFRHPDANDPLPKGLLSFEYPTQDFPSWWDKSSLAYKMDSVDYGSTDIFNSYMSIGPAVIFNPKLVDSYYNTYQGCLAWKLLPVIISIFGSEDFKDYYQFHQMVVSPPQTVGSMRPTNSTQTMNQQKWIHAQCDTIPISMFSEDSWVFNLQEAPE